MQSFGKKYCQMIGLHPHWHSGVRPLSLIWEILDPPLNHRRLNWNWDKCAGTQAGVEDGGFDGIPSLSRLGTVLIKPSLTVHRLVCCRQNQTVSEYKTELFQVNLTRIWRYQNTRLQYILNQLQIHTEHQALETISIATRYHHHAN